MSKQTYQACLVECGVVTDSCGHKHRTFGAAKKCGDRQYVYVDPSGAESITTSWWNGGVYSYIAGSWVKQREVDPREATVAADGSSYVEQMVQP